MTVSIGMTGVGGWIGSQVYEYFQKSAYDVYDLSCWTRSKLKRPTLERLPRIDWVVHMGASTSRIDSIADPLSTYINNLTSTINALEIASKKESSFIFTSSYVYGSPQYLPIDESHPIALTNPYMSSKYLSEKICLEIGNQLSIPLVILRPFNIYGPGVCRGRLVSDLISNLHKEETLIVENPTPIRDYLYFLDFAALLKMVIEDGVQRSGEIYNVGYGISYSNLEVAQILQGLIGRNQKIIVRTRPPNGKNQIEKIIVDIKKINQSYHWGPKYSLEGGLSDILERL